MSLFVYSQQVSSRTSLAFYFHSSPVGLQIYAEAESNANLFALPRRYRICGAAKLRRSIGAMQIYLHYRGATVYVAQPNYAEASEQCKFICIAASRVISSAAERSDL